MLLNRYQETNTLACRSRGELVTAALTLQSLHQVDVQLPSIDWHTNEPFDLVLLQGRQRMHYCWNDQQCQRIEETLNRPFILTSSSANIEEATQWQYACFSRFITEQPRRDANTALAFHLTIFPEIPLLGYLCSV